MKNIIQSKKAINEQANGSNEIESAEMRNAE